MMVFVVSGLWHGANWTFMIWGALHGLFMIAAILWSYATKQVSWPLTLPPGITTGFKIFVTFNLVSFAWIFFRANSLADAVYIVTHLLVGLEFRFSLYGTMPGGIFEFAIAFVAILLMELVHWLQMTTGSMRLFMRRQPLWLRWSAYYTLALAIIMFGNFGLTEFIYFQF
jgi:hypothetical protein